MGAAAVEVLETQPPGPALVYAYNGAAQDAYLSGRFAETLELSEKALRLAEQLRDQRGIALALVNRGFARSEYGDLAGLDDVQDALNMALSHNMGHEAPQAYDWLSDLLWWIKGPQAAIKNSRKAIAFTQRRGQVSDELYSRIAEMLLLFDAGDWQRLHGEADSVLEEISDRPQLRVMLLPYKALVLALRGKTREAVSLEQQFLPLARQIGNLQLLVPALIAAALVRASVGDGEAIHQLANQFAEATEERIGWRARRLPEMIRALIQTGHHDVANQLLVNESDVHMPRDRHSAVTAQALVAEAGGRIEEALDLYTQAAQRWRNYGSVPEEGHALLGAGRCLLGMGQSDKANVRLREARDIFTRLGARPLIDEVDRYLGEAQALSG